MKVHGCAFCGARFPTYAGLQEHLLTHRTVCHTCNRAFTRRAQLITHQCVTANHHLCESCRRTFSTRCKLKRHLRDASCSQPLPRNRSGKGFPSVRKTQMILLNHHRNKIPIYKMCLPNTGQASVHRWREVVFKQDTIFDSDTRALDLRPTFQEQTTACKINLSYGFILRHTISGRYKYYHSSCNCCGRYLDEPSLGPRL